MESPFVKELAPRLVYAALVFDAPPTVDPPTVDPPGTDLASSAGFLFRVVPAVVLPPEVLRDDLSLENMPPDFPDF